MTLKVNYHNKSVTDQIHIMIEDIMLCYLT
jgi:hypothetical protein